LSRKINEEPTSRILELSDKYVGRSDKISKTSWSTRK